MTTNKTLRRALQVGLTAFLLGAVYLVRTRAGAPAVPAGPAAQAPSPAGPSAAPLPLPPVAPVTEAFRSHRSNVELETGGRVLRVLPDDREGSPHERFLVRVEGGTSVLVAHNLDLAPRVPVAPGDSVELRGEYEWNPRGGVIHWTHRDPDGRHAAGWIRLGGRLYQ